MKKLTLSLLCTGLITSTVLADDVCIGAYNANNYPQAAACYIQQSKIDPSYTNYLRAGKSKLKQGLYTEALPYFLEAEKKAHDLTQYSVVYSALGAIYTYTGNSEKQYYYSMKDLEISLKTGESLGSAYSNIGMYYINSQPQQALMYFEKALEYKEEAESAVTYSNMASAYGKIGNPSKQEELALKAIAIGEKTGQYTKPK